MYPDFNAIDEHYFYGGPLGAVWSKDKTTFRIWTPAANEVTVNLYSEGSGGECLGCYPMFCHKGLWETTILGDLSGKYYTYTVRIGYTEQETIDIYAALPESTASVE